MHLTDYFRQIDDAISNCPAISYKEVLFEQRTKYIGFIKGMLTFRDGSELYFKEFINTEVSITKYKYGYHYQKDNKLIFRYDNHPYPAKGDFPTHHKHVSAERNIIPTSIPNLEDILREILFYLP